MPPTLHIDSGPVHWQELDPLQVPQAPEQHLEPVPDEGRPDDDDDDNDAIMMIMMMMMLMMMMMITMMMMIMIGSEILNHIPSLC